MEYLINADILQTLGISWQKILLYLANFAILSIGLTFLLYKPVKKFMKKRQDEIASEYAKAEKANEELEQVRAESARLIEKANEEADRKMVEIKELKQETILEKEKILQEATVEANNIVARANEEALKERKKAVKDARGDIIDMALDLASNILEREVTQEDNDKLISDCIKEWENND